MHTQKYETLDQVINRFDNIIKWSQENQSNLGLFPLVYRRTTILIKSKLEQGDFFDDNQRMEQLIILFASRYFDALDLYRAGNQPTSSWFIAFNAAADPSITVIQHLFLGINAHMSLDLGIACFEVLQGANPAVLKDDFKKIELLLVDIMNQVIESIHTLSPWIKFFSRFFDINSRKCMNLVSRVRLIAWSLTERMSRHQSGHHQYLIHARDVKVSKWAKFVYQPGMLLQPFIALIKYFEEKNFSLILDSLT